MSHTFEEFHCLKGRKWNSAKLVIFTKFGAEWQKNSINGPYHYIVVGYNGVKENNEWISTSGGHAGFCQSSRNFASRNVTLIQPRHHGLNLTGLLSTKCTNNVVNCLTASTLTAKGWS